MALSLLLSRAANWRYIITLWPMLIILVLAQLVMHWTGNSASIGVPVWLSALDGAIFLLVFGSAAIWVQWPVARYARRLHERSQDYGRMIETVMADLPWRALKAFSLAGTAYAVYLIILVLIVAAANNATLTLRMFVALSICLGFGAAVLAPAMGLVNTVAYTVRLRKQLASSNAFTGDLGGSQSAVVLTGSARRPWLVFLVTGLLPTSLLALCVYLALGVDDPVEKGFIMSQALVLFVIALFGSVNLVYTVSYILKQVTSELSTGLAYMRQGYFEGRVPVLLDDELGELARGLNTALKGLQEREDIKDSLSIATEIQQGLLPGKLPDIPGYTACGLERSCHDVGGDYYDCITLPDGRLWLMVADVSGKGYPAALTVANLQAMLRGLAYLNVPIEDAAAYINDTLCDTMTGGRFVTLFMGKLQPQTHAIIWINAGHVPPMLLKEDETILLEATVPPMGVAKGVQFEAVRQNLDPGDMLLAYTDGVTEARDKTGEEMFGEARLRQWLEERRSESLDELPGHLLGTLDAFGGETQEDDMTMLYVKREQV